MEKLTRLANEGLAHDEIAQVCLSPVVDVPPPLNNRTCLEFLMSD